MSAPKATIVSFRRMEDGTREDYEMLDASEREYARWLPDHVLAAIRKLDSTLVGYPVSRLEHSLQAATRALKDDIIYEVHLRGLTENDTNISAQYRGTYAGAVGVCAKSVAASRRREEKPR